ncbi:hypothetical protein D3C73_879630 [compost metagenome]
MPLSAGQIVALIVNDRIVPFSEADDGVVNACRPCCFLDLPLLRVGLAEANIVADCTIKQNRILKNNANLPKQRSITGIANIHVIVKHCAARWIFEPEQQLEHRALARSAYANNRRIPSCRNAKIELLQNRLVRLVRESHVAHR